MASLNVAGSSLRYKNLLVVIKQTAFEEYSQVSFIEHCIGLKSIVPIFEAINTIFITMSLECSILISFPLSAFKS